MITTMLLAIIVGIAVWVLITIIVRILLPCEQCPLRDQCKQLEDNGYPNICTQKMLKSNYDEKL